MARSNRQLTQFAVDRLRQQLLNPTPGQSTAGNTTVVYDECTCCAERPPHIVVKLFDKEIFRAYTSPLNGRTIVGIQLKTGDFYDSKGRPSRTTRERLNGLLDFVCTAGVIPEGVRVFIREDGLCCVGKGESCKVFDASNPALAILAHPSDFVVS